MLVAVAVAHGIMELQTELLDLVVQAVAELAERQTIMELLELLTQVAEAVELDHVTLMEITTEQTVGLV
jgi:hypothetical protein